MADEILKVKVGVEADELEKLAPETKRVLDEAARAGESYNQRLKRLRDERIAELQVEKAAVVKALGEQRSARIREVNEAEDLDRKRVASAQKAAVLAAQVEGKSLQERLAVYKNFERQKDQIEADAAKGRAGINQRFDGLQSAANLNFEKAAGEIKKTTSALGQLKSVAEPVFDGLRNGRLSVDDITASFGRAASAAGPLGAALGGLLAGIGVLKSSADAASQYKSELEGVSRAGAITEKTAAGLILALQRSGGNAGDAAGLVSQFTSRLNEAQSGSADAAASFARLGVTADDLKSKSPDEILFQISDGLLKIADQQGRVRGASEIFGDDDAVKIARVAGSLRETANEAEKLGLVLGPNAKAQIEAYQKQVNELGAQWEAFKVRFGTGGAGVIANTLEYWTGFFGGSGQIQQDTEQIGRDARAGIQRGLKDEKPGGFFSTTFGEFRNLFRDWKEGFGGLLDDREKYGQAIQEIAKQTGNGTAAFREAVQSLESFGKEIGATKEQVGVLTGGNLQLLKSLRDNIEVFKQAASASGLSVAEIIKATKGNVEYAQSVINSKNRQNELIKTHEDEARVLRELQAHVGEYTEEVKRAGEAEKSVTESSRLRLENLKLENAELVRRGEIDEVGAAKRTLEVVVDSTNRQEQAARAYYETRMSLARSTFFAELREAGASVEGQIKAEQAAAARRAEIQNEYETKLVQTAQQREAATLDVERAAADERSRLLDQTTADLDVALRERVSQIEESERRGTISHAQAEDKKFAATKNRIDGEVILIQQQLQQEHVGADEKQRLTERLSDLGRQSREADVEHNRARIDAEIRDEEAKVATLRALSEQSRVKADAEADLKAKQLKALGFEEIEIAQQVAKLKAASLEAELRNLDAIIRSKRAAKAPEAELLQLETERLRLSLQLENAQLVASGRIVEGVNAQTNAIDKANGALVDYINTYTTQANLGIPGAGKIAGDAERIKKAAADAAAAASGIYSQLAGISAQATEYAKSITIENVREAMAWIDTLQKRVNQFGEGDGQIGGLIRYANDQNRRAIEEVQKAVDAALRAEAERLREERQRAYDEATAAYEDYVDEKSRIDSDYEKTLRGIEKSRRESERKYTSDRLAIATRTKDALTALETEIADKAKDEAERTAFEKRRIAVETAKALRDIENNAQRDLLSKKADFIVEESNLKKQLAEAQKKAAGGDADAAKEAERIQGELSALEEKKRIEADRKAGIDKAKASGRSKEEIDAEIERVNAKADAELRYQEQRLTLIQNGDTAALAELESNFQEQLRLADKTYSDQLQYLKDKNQLEEDERASAKAKEDAEWQKRRDDILGRQQTELADLKTKYDNEKSERDKALKQAERDHDASLSALETRTAEAFSKMSALAQKYFNDLKAGIASIGSIPAPGGGGQPGSAGTDDKPGGGGGSSIRTNDDAGSKKSSGSSPGGGNKGNSQRQPPPSPPPPKPTPPPSKPTPPPAPSGGGSITAEDLVSGKGVPVFYYEDDRSLSKSDKALRKEFNDVYKVAASNLLNGLPIKGQYDRLREIAKSAQDANLSELMFRSISILLDVAARTKGSGYTNQGTGFGFEEGPSDTPDGGKIIQDHAPPDKFGEPPPGPTEQAVSGKPGGLTATGQTITTSKPTGTKATATGVPAGESAKRDPKLLNDLIFEAQQVNSIEARDKLTVKVREALKAGKITQEDVRKIDAELDFAAFKSGINLGGKSLSGQLADVSGPTPLAASAGLRAASVPDVNRRSELFASPALAALVKPPAKPKPKPDGASVGDSNAGSPINIDKIEVEAKPTAEEMADAVADRLIGIFRREGF